MAKKRAAKAAPAKQETLTEEFVGILKQNHPEAWVYESPRQEPLRAMPPMGLAYTWNDENRCGVALGLQPNGAIYADVMLPLSGLCSVYRRVLDLASYRPDQVKQLELIAAKLNKDPDLLHKLPVFVGIFSEHVTSFADLHSESDLLELVDVQFGSSGVAIYAADTEGSCFEYVNEGEALRFAGAVQVATSRGRTVCRALAWFDLENPHKFGWKLPK